MRKTVSAALLAALAATTAIPAAAQVQNDETVLALAGLVDNNSFDRAQLMIGNQIQYWLPVFDTLVFTDPSGAVQPNLATGWSYNEDNTILTLQLREGVQFTDGTLFDAEAVKANIEYLRDNSGQNSYMVSAVQEVEVVSPTEVKLHLNEPDPSLLTNLAVVGGAMASPASLGAAGSESAPVGSGPYTYDTANSVAGRQYVYQRNPDYWNAEAYPFDTVTITPINDQVARINALKAGQIDAGLGDAKAVADAEASGLGVNTNVVNWIGLFLADREGNIAEPLADVRVRQAINMAFDEAAILQYIGLGFGELTDQVFPPTSEAYVPELDNYYSYDPEKAKALLAEAGYPEGFSLTMPETNTFAPFNPVIEQQLGQIGIDVEYVRLAPGTTITELRSGRYPAYLFQLGHQGTWADMVKTLFPDSPWNTSQVEDPELVALLDQAQMASGDEQVQLFQDINRHIVEQAWYAPWYRMDTIYLTTPDTSVEMQAGNAVPWIRNFAPAG